jgi:hypothetical protein
MEYGSKYSIFKEEKFLWGHPLSLLLDGSDQILEISISLPLTIHFRISMSPFFTSMNGLPFFKPTVA